MNTKYFLMTALSLGMAACGPQPQLQSESFSDSSSAGIIGGVAVQPTEAIAKSTVAIETAMYGVFCSGVLVGKNLVMTAGHCTGVSEKPNQMSIVFGANLKGRVQKRKVLGGRVHPNWPALTEDQEKNWGDIALLRFEGEAPAGFTPVPMLASSSKLKNGTDVILAGYGLTKMNPDTNPYKLMKVTVKLSDVKYSETEILFEQYQGKGACHGDSGGPAYVQVGGRLALVGVTSRSATLAGGETCMEGSVYTSVPAQKNFLKTAISQLNSPQFVPNEPIPQPKGLQ